MRSMDIELIHSVEDGLKERLELDSRPEVRRLLGQCSILVVIAGIVAGLIATWRQANKVTSHNMPGTYSGSPGFSLQCNLVEVESCETGL